MRSLLFEAQDILSIGLSMTNPAKTIRHQRHSYGFVDNTTVYHSQLSEWLHKTPAIEIVFQGLQKDAQIWECDLWTTGGLLELSKCRFYIVYWTFTTDGLGKMVPKAEMSTPAMQLTEDNTGRLQTLEQLDLDDAFKTLGIRMTISGGQTAQIAAIKRKATTMRKESSLSASPTSRPGSASPSSKPGRVCSPSG